MKVVRILLLSITVGLAFAACGSIPGNSVLNAVGSFGAPALSGAAGGGGGGSSGGTIAAAPAGVDFDSGEILVSRDGSGMEDAAYFVAKVLKAASPATNNQAEALAVDDGKKYWVNYSFNSRKAANGDIAVGTAVAYPRGWGNHAEVSNESYRKSWWKLGNVTSTKDMFKGIAEVDGEPYYVKYLRIPTDPIK